VKSYRDLLQTQNRTAEKLNTKHHLDGLGKFLMRAIRHLENTAYEDSLKGFAAFSPEKRRQRGDVVTSV